MMLREGTFLQNRYEILEQIGSGGMSVVYKAKCHKLNRLVAIKVLKAEFCDDSGFVAKFQMEAQAAARLSHPNIVNVYDVVDEEQLHYIVMELIEGITLKSYIVKKGKLEFKESIGIALQVAQGIEAAHEQHIIHRDIKPQNMLISKDGKVKVADFGIARAVSAQTMNSAAMGSVHYISPEQARGALSDERSDLYSLGITMYEMVTGRLPFEGDNTVSIALAHLESAIVPPRVYAPELPTGLEQIILKCAEKKPERRYASAGELIADLRRVLLEPEARIVPAGSEAVGASTIQISKSDLEQIKERSRAGGQEEHKQELENSYRKNCDEGPSLILESKKNISAPQRGAGRSARKEEPAPQIERLLAGAGVVVAVIIVAVMIVVVSRLGGLFHSGTGKLQREAVTGISTEEPTEKTLLDTQVYMPDVRNMTEDLAENLLSENFLTMKRTYEYFDDVEKGRVASQNPAPGEIVLKGANVNVVISSGSDKIDLTQLGIGNLDATTAERFLNSKNITVNIVPEESETVKKGSVLRYEPQMVSEYETVTLYVSSGPHVETVSVPALTGKTEEDAIALLAESGLLPGETDTEHSDTAEKGTVLRQGVLEGVKVERGTKVDYVVSSGPQAPKQRYVASINEVYDLSSLIGPGAGGANIRVMVRLHQGTETDPIYKVLTPETVVKGNVLLPVSYTAIESVDGSNRGTVEVVDVGSGAVLKSYPLTFFPMD